MRHQSSFDKQPFEEFYENRSRLNHETRKILGFNLHDQSKESNSSDLLDINSPHKNNNQLKSQNILSDFFTQINQSSLNEKLNKDNLDLKKKIMKLTEQNQSWKSKSQLWDKTKQYIRNQFHIRYQQKAISLQTTDAGLLEQFIRCVNQLLQDKDGMKRSSTELSIHRDEQQRKQKDETSKMVKVIIENEKLLMDNHLLKTKIESFGQERKARLNSIESSIQQKFSQLNNENHLIKQQNLKLRGKIKILETQASQLSKKRINELKKSQVNQKQNTSKQSLQSQFLKNINKQQEKQVRGLTFEISKLANSNQVLKIQNQKLKKIVEYAAGTSQEFMGKLKTGVQITKNQFNVVSQYYESNIISDPKPTYQSSFKDHRFRIIKSRSLEKHKSLYKNLKAKVI